MAVKCAEAWISSDGSIVALKKSDGGWMYFVNGHLMVNKQELLDMPYVIQRVNGLVLEMIEAKGNV